MSHCSDQYLELISGVKVPIAVLGAEIDRHSPPEFLKQFEEVLAAKPEVRKSNPSPLKKKKKTWLFIFKHYFSVLSC